VTTLILEVAVLAIFLAQAIFMAIQTSTIDALNGRDLQINFTSMATSFKSQNILDSFAMFAMFLLFARFFVVSSHLNTLISAISHIFATVFSFLALWFIFIMLFAQALNVRWSHELAAFRTLDLSIMGMLGTIVMQS